MRADAVVTGARHLPGGASIQPALLRMLGWCLAVLLIASALLPLVPRLAAPRTALTLEVAGTLARIDADAVRRAVAGLLDRDFHELDLVQARAAVEALPWVARARVERSWPALVRVHVWEHRAVARWGERALLSEADAVFTPPALDSDLAGLPRLSGPDGRQAAVRAMYEALRASLAGSAFAPVRLALNARGEWTATTADGIELRLGRMAADDAVARLSGPVRTALEGRLQEVAYVDLHYVNGFAVGWRDERHDATRSPGSEPEGRDD